jgi:hypothetical protein
MALAAPLRRPTIPEKMVELLSLGARLGADAVRSLLPAITPCEA